MSAKKGTAEVFGADYKTKYLVYKQQLTCTFPSRFHIAQDETFSEIIDDLRETLGKIERNELEAAHRDRFLAEYLPQLVDVIMGQQYRSYQACYRKANAFLCLVMQDKMRRLREKKLADAEMLQRIFAAGKKYYDTSLMASVGFMAENDFLADCTAVGVKRDDHAGYSTVDKMSKFRALACNIDCFGQLGGFKLVLQIIAESEARTEELAFIKRLIDLVGGMVEHMSKDQWEANVLPIAKAGIAYFSKVSDAELKTMNMKEQDIKDFATQLQRLLKTSPDDDRLHALQPVEELELSIAIKLFSLPALDRRMTGLGIISSRLAGIKQKWPTDLFDKDAKARSFADWLGRNKFVELLLVEPLHPELLRRSSSLLAFLYCWSMISGSQVGHLWEMAAKTHDTLQAALYQSLETLAPHLTRRDSESLLDCLRALPRAQITTETVTLLNALGRNEYFRNKRKSFRRIGPTKEPERLRGGTREDRDGLMSKRTRDDFDQGGNYQEKRHHRSASGDKLDFVTAEQQPLLVEPDPYIRDEVPIDLAEPAESFGVLQFVWELSQEDAVAAGLGLAIQPRVTELFITLITRYFAGRCRDYVQMCEELLVFDRSPLQSGRIYQKLVEHLAKEKSFVRLEPAPANFLARMIINLVRFKRAAAQKAISTFMRDSKDGKEDSESRYDGLQTNDVLKVNYYSELEQRFSLLHFLVDKGKLPVPPDCVNILWQTFILYSFTSKETASFFEFMQNLTCTELGVQLVIDGAFDSFFEEALLRLDPKDYTQGAFSCLKNIVLALNSYYRHVKTLPGGAGIEIVSDQLIGMQVVWDVALEARDEEVQKTATAFLQAVYRKVAPESAKFVLQIREGFVRMCMRQIQSGEKMLGTKEEVQTRIVRALSILTKYVEDSEVESKPVPIPVQAQGYEFLVSTSWMNKDKRSIKVCSTMTVREMLELVKKVQERPEPLEDLLFFAKGGSQLRPSSQTIHEAGISEDTWISVTAASKDEAAQQQQQTSDQSCKNTLPLQSQAQSPTQNLPKPQGQQQQAQQSSGKHVQFKVPEVIFDPVPAEAVKQLLEIFPDHQPAILQSALRKAKNDVNQASILLTDPSSLAQIQTDAISLLEAPSAPSVHSPTAETASVASSAGPTAVELPSAPKVPSLASTLANSEEHFTSLYSLLDSPAAEVVERAGSLLMKIPVNTLTFEQFIKVSKASAAEGIPWDQLIPGDSPYKLAYALRIVTNILESPQRCAEWAAPFILQDGFNHLLLTLLSIPVAEKLDKNAGPVLLKAVETIVRVIGDFVSAAFLHSPSESYKLFLAKTNPENVQQPNQQNKPDVEHRSKLNLNAKLAKIVIDDIEQFQLPVNLVSILAATAEGKDNKASSGTRKTLLHLLSTILCYDLSNFSTLFAAELFPTFLLDTFLAPENENGRETLRKELILWFEVWSASNTSSLPPESIPPAVFVLNTLLAPIFQEKPFPIKSEPYFQFLGELLPSSYTRIISSRAIPE